MMLKSLVTPVHQATESIKQKNLSEFKTKAIIFYACLT